MTNQDKLLVQAVVTDRLPPGQVVSEFWAKTKPDNMHQKKLRCCLVDEAGFMAEERGMSQVQAIPALVGGQHSPSSGESRAALERKVCAVVLC